MIEISPTDKYAIKGYVLVNAHYNTIQFRPVSGYIYEIIFRDKFYDEIMEQFNTKTPVASVMGRVTIYITSRRLTFLCNKINLVGKKNNVITLTRIHTGNVDKVIF